MTHIDARPPGGLLEGDVSIIERSSLFDDEAYASASDMPPGRAELIRHYLSTGEPAGLSPSDAFDVAFYRAVNPDVVESGMSPLVHYLRHGRAEGRYPTRRMLRLDAAKVERSGLLESSALDRGMDADGSELTRIEHLLLSREDAGDLAGHQFDAHFYSHVYEDVRNYGKIPLVHYVEVGRNQGRIRTDRELQHRKHLAREHFREDFYLRQLGDTDVPPDALEHYVLHGERFGLDPSPDFCCEYYKRRYPDLRGLDIFLFDHFIQHGRAEGRIGRPDFSKNLVPGKRAFDPAKRTFLLANHEASRTGAPLLGLVLGSQLAEDHNLVVSLRGGGELEHAFIESSCLVSLGITDPLDAEYLLAELKRTHAVEAVILNSIETSDFGAAALFADIPSVALIHEFAEYTQPYGRTARTVGAVDRVIVPAEIVRDSVQREVEDYFGNRASNIIVRSQGYLPYLPRDEKLASLTREQILKTVKLDEFSAGQIVLSAGHAHIRKGVDLFVQTAAEVRDMLGNAVRFIWVGGGYEPTTDPHYSLWVADMVRRLRLEDIVYFLPPQESLEALFDLASVFYLPSRLDPFPNVALDAFRAEKPVVCFDGATGIAECFRDGSAPGAAVPFCSVHEAATAIAQLLSEQASYESYAVALAERFNFGAYVRDIEETVEGARTSRSAIKVAVDRIRTSSAFDVEFYNGLGPLDSRDIDDRSILEYAARSFKGLMFHSPRPGFSENLFRNEHAGNGSEVALDTAVKTGSDFPPTTHKCVTLGETERREAFAGRVAVHLHLHYPDLAAEFVERLERSQCKADVFVTTTSEEKRRELYYAFRQFNLGAVQIIEVPNRGRDIAPFFVDLREHVRFEDYDLIGHFHGKRSVAVDGGMGDRWRKYLLDTLMGTDAILREIFGLFSADPLLGLVFAEDSHCVGWGANRQIANDLALRIGGQLVLPEHPFFPLGTMFWAKPAALEPIFSLGLDDNSFPGEPIPYDGTILHAIERMLPSVVESSGHGWHTVFRRGLGW